jgi:catechol 2,3-dioxygenase-like lactoylglutathione lyase family enzyme
MLKYLGVLIAVKDIAVSRHFYEECLGMQVREDFGIDVGYEGGLAIHQKDNFQELLGGEDFPVVTRSHAGELYFESNDVDAAEQKLKEMGVEFVHPTREQPWAQRVMRVYDPDGHVLEIAEKIDATVLRLSKQGLTEDEICKKTGLSRAFVEAALCS